MKKTRAESSEIKRSAFTSKTPERVRERKKSKETEKNSSGDCEVSRSTSHTHFFKKDRYKEEHDRITRNQYYGATESISGSSDSFHCLHGPEGKQYTEKGLLKRNILKKLDPIPLDFKWNDSCPSTSDWEIAKKVVFLVTDPMGVQQIGRLQEHICDLSRIAKNGFNIKSLDCIALILDYLVENYQKQPELGESLLLLLEKLEKPILLDAVSDIEKYSDLLRQFIGYLGYLLNRLEEDELFDYVSRALLWHLSAADSARFQAVQLRHFLAVAGPVLYQTIARMLALASAHRFPTFLEIALLLAYESVDSCIDMMGENIIENILYRFNPYFPSLLPVYDINPVDLQDPNVKLGDSSVHMSTTLSLLLVLLKTTKHFLELNPQYRRVLPCPDDYAQRCFTWCYRYECRAREHRHQRNTLTVIISVMLKCFGDRLTFFGANLLPDLMSLSVLTELPPRSDWTNTVNFNIFQSDVYFKKILIYLCVDFLKIFPGNHAFVESRHWLLGLMYLLDPELCYLRTNWAPSLYSELRKTTFQALVCVLPHLPHRLANDYGLIRRLMWYIEWYSVQSYELPVLYWCLRVLQVATYDRESPMRTISIRHLFDTHGIVILMHLCNTLLSQKLPLVEKSQAIIALSMRLLTSAVDANSRLQCCVYPHLVWPSSIPSLVMNMMDVVMQSLSKHYIISDRWLVSLLNFIWETIIWKDPYREIFISNNGIYKLLDLITITRPPIQSIALALVCDVARAGGAVGQLVTWRANLRASYACPSVVKRGATIATLLAAICQDECRTIGMRLDENGIIQDLDFPLMSSEIRRDFYKNEFCKSNWYGCFPSLIAADLAGSRLSKAYALLHMLSDDLEFKVALADEAYNLYKNIELAPEDEAVLVLCSHYLTIKLNEAWVETEMQCRELVPEDQTILDEFLNIGKGWAKNIQQQQKEVIAKDRAKKHREEQSLHEFVARVRLNVALDALREVRHSACSADRERVTHALICDAVRAHHRRSRHAQKLTEPILRTYMPPLHDQNMAGQYVKVYSIPLKNKVRQDDSDFQNYLSPV